MGDEASLTSIVPLIHLSRVTLVGGPTLVVRSKETLDFAGNCFSNILYVSLAHRNLLFIEKLVDLGNIIYFFPLNVLFTTSITVCALLALDIL